MAVTKVKRSVHLAQPSEAARGNNPRASNRHLERSKPAERKNQTRSTQEALLRRPRPTRRATSKLMFPEAKGRVIEFIEFFADPRSNSNSVHLRFQDNTSLSLQFATGLAMEAYFSHWKAGNERVLRYWPRVDCQPVF